MVSRRVLLLPLALFAGACAGSDRPAEPSAGPSTSEAPAPTAAAPATYAPTATVPNPTTTAAPTTTTMAAPAGPETVETVIGRSTIRFTYPANLTPEEREVLDTYHRFLKAMWSASDPPDPGNAELAATVAPARLSDIRSKLDQYRLTGQYAYGDYDSHPQSLELSTDVLGMNDCSLDSSATYSHEGMIISPSGTVHDGTLVVLERDTLGWKVRSWLGTREPCTP